jgi:hypothetical protein
MAEDRGYDPQLDTYHPRWLRLPEKREHYPIGTCMLLSTIPKYAWGACAGAWDSIQARWVLIDESERQYEPTHYAPTPHSITAE